MTNAGFVVASLAALSGLVAPVQAQDPDSDRLRALTRALPELPAERRELKANFAGTSAIATDAEGRIYVLDRPAEGDPVIVLDRSGKVLRSWGKGMFVIPHGIRIDPGGNVWTVDAHTSMVYKFSSEGKKLLEIAVGEVPDTSRAFCGATDIAFARGRIFVADGYCNARVVEYDSTGRKVRQWGRAGTGPGEFSLVHAIAVGPDGNLYVADRENGRVQRFDLDGKFLGEWTFGGQLFNVAFSTRGDVYVSTHPRVPSLDDDFNVVKLDPKTGSMVSRLAVRSHELSVGADGTLYPATRTAQLLLFVPR
jgi:DNA-binding beta-propeller fold protein YncE